MRSKKVLCITLFIFIIMFIFFKFPNDNKDLFKFNELEKRINEIEKLIKSSRKSFDVIKKALLDMQMNKGDGVNINNLKSLLKVLQSKLDYNQSKNKLDWSRRPSTECEFINMTGADINLMDIYDTLDFSDSDGGVWKQGFEIKNDLKFTEKLKVFIVPHSHQDPGWIKTVEDYFDTQTKLILDSMLQFLVKEPKMKFIHAEISFFKMWWKTLNHQDRETVKRLVKDKQLEIVTGGWVMTDEANSHYFSILNQLTEGHMWLKKHFDYSPRSSWSIDPFGYSESMPYILRKSGLENLVIQRVHYILKKDLALKKQLEFLWKQTWDSHHSSEMPCHIMPFFSYDVPHTCGPDPKICCQFDFIRKIQFGCPWGITPVFITDDNVEERSKLLMDQYRKKSQLFNNGNLLLVPLGDDFRYQTVHEWTVQYDNYKKIMDYMNNRKEWNIEIKFATLSDYFDSFNRNKLAKLPTLVGDMFTYSDRNDHYWSGFFTSRPLLKSLDRVLMHYLRSTEIVFSLALIYQQKYGIKSTSIFNSTELKYKIRQVRRTLSLFQHHDAITGTSTKKVVIDYGNKLLKAIILCQNIFLKSAQGILEKNVGNTMMFELDELEESYGHEKQIRFADLLVNNEKYVYLFNSLSQPRQVVVNIPIKTNINRGIKIVGSGNQMMKCQLMPYVSNNNVYHKDLHVVSFKLNIGPLAFEQVQIIISEDFFSDNNCIPVEIYNYNGKDSSNSKIEYKVVQRNGLKGKFIILQNLVNTLYISHFSGNIEKLKTYNSDDLHDFFVKFKTYGARKGNEMSGAYIFVPDGEGKILTSDGFPPITHFKGNLFDEVRIINEYTTQRIKLYQVEGNLANAIDIENIIDISGSENLELSMALMTDTVVPSDIFYSDSNCFQFIKRKTLMKLPIQGNVYPMTCGCFVESEMAHYTNRMSVFSKQSNGVMGGQINFGNKSYSVLEVFQDRRLNQDDNRGLFEPLDDNKVTSVKHRIVFEDWKSTKKSDHKPYNGDLSISSYQLLNDLTYPIHELYIQSNLNNKVPNNLLAQKSLLTGLGLPCDLHIVNLRTEDNDLPKLTLHRPKLNCDSKFIIDGSCDSSQRKSILFKSMFDDLSIKYVNKALLTGLNVHERNIFPEDVKVNAMEIDTFELQFDSK